MGNVSSEILVDKRLLITQQEELNLLQSCLLLPKPVNVLALKKRFGIRLNQYDLMQEIQDKNSPLHKYLQAIILCYMSLLLWSQKEEVKHTLENIKRKQIEQALELLSEEIDSRILQEHFSGAQKNPQIENNLPPDVLINIEEVRKLQYYLLMNSKAEDLKYYLQFTRDPKEMAVIEQIITRRYQLIEKNYDYLDQMAKLAKTDEERAEVAEKYVRYTRHLALASHQNMRRNLSHISLQDPVVRKQFLYNQNVQEEVYTNGFVKYLKKDNKIKMISEITGISNKDFDKNIEITESQNVESDGQELKQDIKLISTNHPETHQRLIEQIRIWMENVAEEPRQILIQIQRSLTDDSDQKKNIITRFNELVKKYPELEFLSDFYNCLTGIPSLDIEKLIEPELDFKINLQSR